MNTTQWSQNLVDLMSIGNKSLRRDVKGKNKKNKKGKSKK